MVKILMSMILVLAMPVTASAQTMYGGGSGQQDGEFGIVDQTTGEFTVIGDPTTEMDDRGLTGLAFDVDGRLWGGVSVGSAGSGTTSLIEINPATGDRLDLVGTINDGGVNLRIVDLALQPSTGTLFGLEFDGSLYTIDKNTAEADLVGDPGGGRGGIAFAPDGTLYLVPINGGVLWRVDPATGVMLSMPIILTESACLDGLAVRPSDGVLFATECDGRDVLRIDPSNGDTEVITPNDPEDDVADLAFQIAPTSAAPTLSSIGMLVLASAMLAFGMYLARAQRRTT